MNTKTIRKIISFSLALMLILIIIRVKVLGMHYSALIYPWRLLKVLSASHYDLIYVSGMGALFVVLAYLFRTHPGKLTFLSVSFIGLAILHIFFGLANIELIRMLGVPFNYQWMYYSDLLGNSEANKAIAENLSLNLFKKFLMLSLLLAAVGGGLVFLLGKLSRYEGLYRKTLWGMAGFLLLFLMVSRYFAGYLQIKYTKTAHPVIAFAESVVASWANQPDLFTVSLPSDLEPFPVRQQLSLTENHAPNQDKVRNVIFFVLESVSSKYVSGYNDTLNVTPVIDQYLNQAMLFTDIYAHSPSTNNTLVSLLGSIYPMISFRSISAEYPQINWPIISTVLKKHHYRTGFFFASDSRFQKMDEFLENRQFDKIADYRSIPCAQDILATEYQFLDGVDEACMVDTFTDWLMENNGSQPFFATLWTMQTHYPYFTFGSEKDYGVKNPLFNRYLNALHYSDAMLGKVLDELKRQGLAESTLVVVVGDHGEAFLQHYQYGHASHIYEENVKVPLIFINPLLFKGEQQSVIGGHIDIGPTLLDILRLPVPEEWQGISLFNPNRTNRAYFFSPWSNYLFGYRDSKYKVIFDATSFKTMVFDLNEDPGELNDLSDQMPGYVELSQQRLAQWVQYHTSLLSERLSTPVAKVSHTQAAAVPSE